MKNNNVNVFLSYCWSDDHIANSIYDYFKNHKDIELHRDKIDIGTWESIKEYMQSISNMDYTIILISDAYLKSVNCMYEALEVMRDRNYKDKIFPAIIFKEIYNPLVRAEYVKYWENQFKELQETLLGISIQNLGKLAQNLKKIQDISSNISEFLDTVSDLNNPEIADVSSIIEEKLKSIGLLEPKEDIVENDLFLSLGIKKNNINSSPTDLQINQFMKGSFNKIVKLITQLGEQYQKENPTIQLDIDQVDSKTVIFQFYKNENLMKELKLFLSKIGGTQENIGVSDNIMSFGNGNSWNGMYNPKFVDGELKLYATMSYTNSKETMTIEEVVGDIWKNYIQIYLER